MCLCVSVCVSVVNREKCFSYPQCKSIYPQCKAIHQMSSCNRTHNTLQNKKGGYSGVNFGHVKSEVFQRGGYFGVNFGHVKSEVFQRGGVFRSKLWSSQIWSYPKGGGYFGVNFGHLKSEVIQKEGWGYSGLQFQKGVNWRIWTKIYCSARNLLVHHSSLSHTMCVETNECGQVDYGNHSLTQNVQISENQFFFA